MTFPLLLFQRELLAVKDERIYMYMYVILVLPGVACGGLANDSKETDRA